ncbi:hypothetical protein [Streptomyces prunicolor]|uniref:hypothetical protein n=1 Tax=Streptomyces prunicolor TaxID=67348 RepID=UPI00131A3BA7|nr:hypothetical protein [Streptomyces prunicolor]
MSTTTTRLGLLKPATTGESVNVATQLNNNLDKIDTNIGFRVVANATARNAISPVWEGLVVRETDTGNCYVSNGSAPVSGSWSQIIVGTALSNLTISGTGMVNLSASASGNDKLAAFVSGDSVDRFRLRADGMLQWGSGSATRDVNLYRSAANILKTDDVFTALTETTTSGLTVATGFSANAFAARKSCGICSIKVIVTRTGSTITADSTGNIADTLIATLPSGYIPADTVLGCFDKGGTADGAATIASDGTITIKSMSPTASLASGGNVSVTATYVL